MSRRSTAVAVLTAALAAGCLSGAPAASAAQDRTDPVVQRAEILQDVVVLSRDGASRITVEVVVTDDVAVEEVFAGLFQGDDSHRSSGGISLDRFTRVGRTDTWRASTWVDSTYRPGRYRLAVFAFDTNGNFGDREGLDAVHLKRNTTMPAFGAGPEPVRQGERLTVSGRLKQLSRDSRYVGYAGKVITISFKPTGGAWTEKGVAVTDADGRWSRAFRARTDGTWRASFAGTASYHAETSSTDRVDVE